MNKIKIEYGTLYDSIIAHIVDIFIVYVSIVSALRESEKADDVYDKWRYV